MLRRGLASPHSDSVISLHQFLQSSSSPHPPPQICQSLDREEEEEEEEEDCLKPSLCFPTFGSAGGRGWGGGGVEIRRAGAGGPGRCPGPGGSSSGPHQSPAGQPRGTASCLQSRCPETRLHAAPTHSRRSAYPVKSVTPVKVSHTHTVLSSVLVFHSS